MKYGFIDVSGKWLLPKLKNSNYKTSWGLYDDSQFNLALQNILNYQSEKNFGLYSHDTHHPNGHPSKSCEHIKYRDGSNRISIP